MDSIVERDDFEYSIEFTFKYSARIKINSSEFFKADFCVLQMKTDIGFT
jgi:hypothetical protein